MERFELAAKAGSVFGLISIVDGLIHETMGKSLIFPKILALYENLLPNLNIDYHDLTVATVLTAPYSFPLVAMVVEVIYGQLEPYANRLVSKLRLPRKLLRTSHTNAVELIQSSF